jgi:alpha-glucosidase (family GH31 glycosyl hydrolase)
MYDYKYLCSSVLYPGLKTTKVYLPYGSRWKDFSGEVEYDGGQTVEIALSLYTMPVFIRELFGEEDKML